jgi:HlyD family secretion protein
MIVIKFKDFSKKKKAMIACGMVVILVTGVWIGINSTATGKDSADSNQLTVSAVLLEKRDLSKVVGTNGVVESENVSKITTSITSNVKELNIQPGDKVQEDDTLCVFDDETIKAEIKKLEETIATNKKAEQYQDGVNQRALTNAKEDQTRQIDNANSDVSEAQNDLDSANNKVTDSENSIKSLSKEIKAKKKNLKSLKKDLEKLKKELQELKTNATTENNGNAESITAKETEITDLQAKTDAAKAEIDTLETSYTQEESNLASLRENAKAADRTLGTAQESLESVEASASQAVQSQIDNINTSKFKTDDSDNETQLEKLKTNLASTVIKAPISGTITYLNIEKGSPASEGVIMKIEDTDALKISVKIKEYDILNIKEGMKATVTCDAIPDVTMQGTVSKIYLTPIAADGNGASSDNTSREYAAEIKLDEKNSDLLIGMNVKTKIVLEENKDVFAVPYEAVTANEANQNIVYAAMDDGKGTYTVKTIPVEKGIETDYYAAISSDELSEGMYIITTPDLVTEGSSVSIQIGDGTGDAINTVGTASDGAEEQTTIQTEETTENTEASGGF